MTDYCGNCGAKMDGGDTKTAKEYLSRYRWQNDRINAKLEQLAELRRKVRACATCWS